MKKDRNCGNVAPYPMYNQYPVIMNGVMPGIPNNIMTQMPMPYMNPMMGNQISGINTPSMNMNSMNTTDTYNYENQINDINNRLNNIERRINNIENTINDTKMTSYANKYSSSNYQMM